MKHIILILTLFIVTLVVDAQTFQPKVAIDLAPRGYTFTSYADPTPQFWTFGNVRTKVGLEFSYKSFSIETDNHVYMQKDGFRDFDYQFDPTRIDFYMRINYRISKLANLRIEHLCVHPIHSDRIILLPINKGHTSIGISYGY